MHRPTTTAAALLVTVAVSAAASAAVTGCTSVERPSGPGPSVATAPQPAPRTDGEQRPKIVQAPAREALQRMDPPRTPSPQKPDGSPDAPAGADPSAPPPSRTHRQAPPPVAAPARRPAAARPDAGATRPAPVRVPATPVTDVCALGEAYGKWRPNSPEAVICRDTYGR
ncbi:hypothetical protein DEJ49_04475 [Streptomyces venezuelae]|uniref:Lipoprotein n=1 Tax=Streptomyces venezuelae TaxID=54571 RepID=A0A5P2CC04_STRVZ|nr:hypothetical protein [Streptomyces venezuelae]QES40336.1 hypothetical protein DEJ49_04475 [Streptomyces venezuelae]